MKIIMYGTEICSECAAAKAQLGNLTAVELDYRSITKNTATLKEFLLHRDHDDPCRMELNVNRHNEAVYFYEHMGMKKVREGDFPIGNNYYMNDYIMSLDI